MASVFGSLAEMASDALSAARILERLIHRDCWRAGRRGNPRQCVKALSAMQMNTRRVPSLAPVPSIRATGRAGEPRESTRRNLPQSESGSIEFGITTDLCRSPCIAEIPQSDRGRRQKLERATRSAESLRDGAAFAEPGVVQRKECKIAGEHAVGLTIRPAPVYRDKSRATPRFAECAPMSSRLKVRESSNSVYWVAALYDRYGPIVRSVVRRLLSRSIRGRVDSEDVANSMWLSVLENRGRLPHNLTSSHAVRAYLVALAKRRVVKAHRRHVFADCRSVAREAKLDSAGIARLQSRQEARASSEVDDLADILAGIDDSLNQIDRDVIQGRLRAESNRQIARSLGVDEGTVRRAILKITRLAVKLRSSPSTPCVRDSQ